MQSLACNSKWLAAILSSEGLIESLSAGAEQFTGYSSQDLVGRSVIQILSDSSALELSGMFEAANEWGHWEGEIVHKARGGKLLDGRGSLSLLAGSGNSSAGYLLVSNLHKSPVFDNCEDSGLAEVAGNLRTFAHDLNNPLAVMMGFTQLLILNTNCEGKIRSDIEKLYSELKRVIQVVERLHKYAFSLYERPQKNASDGRFATGG